MIIGISSYLPKDKELREKRKIHIKRQYTFFKENFPDVKIVCCSQQYGEEDYLPGIEYIKFDHGISLPGARNELLKVFYKTDEDFFLLADDDTIVFDYYGSLDLCKEIHKNPKKFLEFDLITSINPRYMPFKESMLDHKYENERNYCFIPLSCKSNAFCFLKNLKKHYGVEVYYDNSVTNAVGCEDMVFDAELVSRKYAVVTCKDLIMKTPAEDSTLATDENHRREILKKNAEFLDKNFSKFGLVLRNGNVTWNNFNKICNKVKQPLVWIKRENFYEFPENLLNCKKRKKKEEDKPKNLGLLSALMKNC